MRVSELVKRAGEKFLAKPVAHLNDAASVVLPAGVVLHVQVEGMEAFNVGKLANLARTWKTRVLEPVLQPC